MSLSCGQFRRLDNRVCPQLTTPAGHIPVVPSPRTLSLYPTLVTAAPQLPIPIVPSPKPNILFVMTDQQRFDSLRCNGGIVETPNLDALAARGISCDNAYSPCPVCVPARYTLMTGCDSPTTEWFSNTSAATHVDSRTGPYLARMLTNRGYRTWGIGKFHTKPWDEDLGFEHQWHGEENHWTVEAYERDDYVKWLRSQHPAFEHLEQVHGERTDMYYSPQTRAQPPKATAEAWATGQAVEQLSVDDPRPFFGFVSFVQPHPPVAPPVPYNRMFNPDDMRSPRYGPPEIDQADPYLSWMNRLIWADEIGPAQARQISARYHGEVAFLDTCIGEILEALHRRPDASNTLVVFFSDHGELLGDHGAWQKESFFEEACRIPLLIAWPDRLPTGQRYDGLVSLSDLFGIALGASGANMVREGHDVLGALLRQADDRSVLVGLHEQPGTPSFKAMLRKGPWKYIWIANGGRELLFNLEQDRTETVLWNDRQPEARQSLRTELAAHLRSRQLTPALTDDGDLRPFPRTTLPPQRIRQFERGVTDYSHQPSVRA